MIVVPPAQAGAPGPQAVVSTSGGSVTLAVTHGGKTVVQPSPVGITTERADLSRGLTPAGKSRRMIFERYRTSSGKKLDRTVRATETTYRFKSGENTLNLVVRESPDGVAYRYELPQDTGAVTGEASAFVLPADATAWLAKFRRDYENPFLQLTAGTAE